MEREIIIYLSLIDQFLRQGKNILFGMLATGSLVAAWSLFMQKERAETEAAVGAKTSEGDFAIKQFTENYPENSSV